MAVPVILLGAAALAALALAASQKSSTPSGSSTPPGGPTPPDGLLPGLPPLPGLPDLSSIPIPTLPGFPDFSKPGWPTTPGSMPQGPQAPQPPAPPPPVVQQETIQPWAPGDIVRRNFGQNIGQLTPSGALKLRERLVRGRIESSDVTQPGVARLQVAAPWKVPMTVTAFQFLAREMQANDLLMFKPFAPDLSFDSVGGQARELQNFILMRPLAESFVDDPLDTIKGWFTGEQPMAYPISPEGYVVLFRDDLYRIGRM